MYTYWMKIGWFFDGIYVTTFNGDGLMHTKKLTNYKGINYYCEKW